MSDSELHVYNCNYNPFTSYTRTGDLVLFHEYVNSAWLCSATAYLSLMARRKINRTEVLFGLHYETLTTSPVAK
jgi:hypothetical protein